MAIVLERGPFRRFEGEWRLTPLSTTGCKVDFGLQYEFDNRLVGRLAGRCSTGSPTRSSTRSSSRPNRFTARPVIHERQIISLERSAMTNPDQLDMRACKIGAELAGAIHGLE